MDSLIDIAAQLRDGTLSVTDYLATLEERFDAWESRIFAFVPEQRRWERLARETAALLEKYPDPENRPPLFGIPVGVKDIFHVDGLPTRAGSSLPPHVLAGEQSVAVTQLKEAGALVLGKTITTEFAWFGPGPARNPHNPLHTPGGSSSGSAAAVGAGLCPLALGSQTIGSVNRPAAFCGTVGFKPSYDRISKQGVIELSRSHDHVGFFTPTAADGELIASVLCADWSAVPALESKPTVGIPIGSYLEQASALGRAVFDANVRQLQSLGYTVKSIPAMDDFTEIIHEHKLLLAADAAAYHAQFEPYHHLYHTRTAELVAQGRTVDADAVEMAWQGRLNLRRTLEGLMDDNEIDAWITPAAVGTAPAGHASTGDPIMQLPFTNAGLPCLNVPSGESAGLPLGLQMVGRFNQDEQLFAVGKLVEQDVVQ